MLPGRRCFFSSRMRPARQRVEDGGQRFVGDRWAAVADREHHFASLGGGGEIDRAGVHAVLDRVADEVGDHLAKAGGIPLAVQVAVRRESQRVLGRCAAHLIDHVLADRAQVHRRRFQRHRAAKPGGGEVEQIADHLRHHVRAGCDLRGDPRCIGIVVHGQRRAVAALIAIELSGLRRSWPRIARNICRERSTCSE